MSCIMTMSVFLIKNQAKENNVTYIIWIAMFCHQFPDCFNASV